MFGVQELATAAQYRIALVTVVFNNRSYGNVLRDQETQFGGRTIGAQLDNPDFVRLAEAFGVRGRRVADPAALQRALAEELATGYPALIEVTVEPSTETSPWSLIHMRTRPSRGARV
jgi:acetolactate synthase-1/2/3 large subunit